MRRQCEPVNANETPEQRSEREYREMETARRRFLLEHLLGLVSLSGDGGGA